MKHGYVRAAALTPVIRVADCEYNTQQVLEGMKEAFAKKGEGCRISGNVSDGIIPAMIYFYRKY